MARLSFCRSLAALLVTFISASLLAASADSPRERLSLDAGWKFHLGNEWGDAVYLGKAGSGSGPAGKSFADASWRTVDLPHDWAVEMPFDKHADELHGFKTVGRGFESNSIGWYRREFALPAADAGRRIWLEFDGVFRDCTVFVNGWRVGKHESGYGSFKLDVTDVVECGSNNTVAVRVDASQIEGWWYEGAGIYRHVWLTKTAPVAIAPDGVFVYTRHRDKPISELADERFETKLVNLQGTITVANLETKLIAPNGDSICEYQQKATIGPRSECQFRSHVTFVHPDVLKLPDDPLSADFGKPMVLKPAHRAPELWTPESPKLYKLISTVEVGGKIVDRVETEFGIRTVAFYKDKGFLLNGQPYVIKGTCNHQNHAGVGAAMPDALYDFRLAKLKEMGCNAYRCSHYPATPELLAACNRMGLLVLAENRLLGSDEQNLDELKNMVVRDRNHPSIIAWSLGNEELVQTTPVAGRVGATMQNLVKQLDPTRPVTYASHAGELQDGINDIIEVRGWNYKLKDIDAYRARHPYQPQTCTEQSSAVSTRGIYANDKTRGYVSSYDTNFPGWGSSAETFWNFYNERPWLGGGFVWTGFDYRGEATPYGWPCISSHFGLMDTCGFPKDLYYYYQSWWTTNPVLHLFPHWNWAGREDEEISVWCFSNCDEVELFLNGKSLGRQKLKTFSHLEWKVKYVPGVLSAKGYKDGKLIAETKRETTGAPAAIQLTADRKTTKADGKDIAVFTVAVADAQNRIVPTASNLIRFELTGPGKIIGVGNGDPSCHEPDVFVPESAVRALPLDTWRWKLGRDPKSKLPEYDPTFDDSTWETHDARQAEGPFDGDVKGVLRTKVTLTEADLNCRAADLRFGSIHGWGWIYVNGQKVGDCRDQNVPQFFDVKKSLRAGENTIAVGVMNVAGSGGVNKGAALRLHGEFVQPHWQRSVFNGLAQVIVQSSGEAGEIVLQASADGLSSAKSAVPSRAETK